MIDDKIYKIVNANVEYDLILENYQQKHMFQVMYKPGLSGNWTISLLSIHPGFTPMCLETSNKGFSRAIKTNWNFCPSITVDEIHEWYGHAHEFDDDDLYYRTKISHLKKHYFRNTQHRFTEAEQHLFTNDNLQYHAVLYRENKTPFRMGAAHGPGFFNLHQEKIIKSIKENHSNKMSVIILDTDDYTSLKNRVAYLTAIGKFDPVIYDSYASDDKLQETANRAFKLLDNAGIPVVKININALLSESVDEYKKLCDFINEEPQIDNFKLLAAQQRTTTAPQ